MKVFKGIYSKITSLKNSNKDEHYLGHFAYDKFSEADKEELKTWTALSSTTFEKDIDGKNFWFDIILSNNE